MSVNEEASQKIWLITGTSSGFGLRFVLSALRRGDKVIASSRTLESLQAVKWLDLLNDLGRKECDFEDTTGIGPKVDLDSNLRLMQLDVSWSTEAIHAKVNEALAIWGRIDILVNNAGIGLKALIEDASSKDFQYQFQINFFGAIDITNAVLSSMRARKSGTIVINGSRSSWKSEIPVTSLYASSKAALRVYSETLACEVDPFSIRVLILEPGAFRTEGILSQPYLNVHNPISDYDTVREKIMTIMKAADRKQEGDPNKAAELVVDIVRGEGKALREDGTVRDWPLYLPLGGDAVNDIRTKCRRMLDALDEWADVTTGLEITQ
ncbi:hypothetical protein D9758_010694 [Tetrapyrgos nigripes]|uniref:NAD(P)-binding protein n=1 Tax=Tetrapyrgos nigripes TaxID=182062 RepID=A0A8H5GGM0_9AGAR|nr:hypothetical protein D9758_010694 [Tetrapyrgos nigripes]